MFLCTLNVLHGPYESTNGGVSQTPAKTLRLFTSSAEVDPASTDSVCVAKNALGQPIIVPASNKPEGALGPMFGGNYAIGDSRLSAEIRRVTSVDFYGAVAIHDRFETPAQYRSLTAGE